MYPSTVRRFVMKGSRIIRHYLFPWLVSVGAGVALGTGVAGWIAGSPAGGAFWTWLLLFWLVGGVAAAASFMLLGLSRLSARDAGRSALPRAYPAPKPLPPPLAPAPPARRRAA